MALLTALSLALMADGTSREEQARKLAATRDKRWVVGGAVAFALAGVSSFLLYDPSQLSFASESSVRIVASITLAISSFGIFIMKSKRALFNFSFGYTLLTNIAKGHQHWNAIDEHIVLGALPLESQLNTLVKKENITGVVSLVEPFELEQGAFVKPIQQKQWRDAGVQTIHIQTCDYEPVDPKRLEEGADWINNHIKENPNAKIYVHCKAGRGRSTATVLVYLNKYKGLSLADALKYVKAKRPQIHMNSRQLGAVKLAMQ